MHARSLDGKRVLITGIAGFGGSWLAETILKKEKKAKIFGLKRESTSTENIDHIISELQLTDADITNRDMVFQAVEEINPNIVFHLAAVLPTSEANYDSKAMGATNVDGTKNLLDALVESTTDLEIFHFASSSSIYKKNKKMILINEKHPIQGSNAYSKSKIKSEKLCEKYSKKNELPVIITRAFNQAGPRCRADIITNKIARIAASAKNAGIKEFVLGNVNVVRDFTDVRDIANGYWLAAKMGKINQVYNLCSGRGIKVSDIIDMALDYVDLKGKIKIITDKRLLRKGEADIVIGDNSKAEKELGWKPKIPFEQTLKDMIDNYLLRADES